MTCKKRGVTALLALFSVLAVALLGGCGFFIDREARNAEAYWRGNSAFLMWDRDYYVNPVLEFDLLDDEMPVNVMIGTLTWNQVVRGFGGGSVRW